MKIYRGWQPIGIALLLSGCGACGSNESAAAFARSLPEERLARLGQELRSIAPPGSGQPRVFFSGEGIPIAFQDLKPQSVGADGVTGLIHLSGCMDDKVYLVVHGLDSGKPRVDLIPGELGRPEVLWEGR